VIPRPTARVLDSTIGPAARHGPFFENIFFEKFENIFFEKFEKSLPFFEKFEKISKKNYFTN
jgi:hypothetical protein